MDRVAVVTVVTKSFLAHARALATRLRMFHPDVPMYVLLADQVDGTFDPAAEPFSVVKLSDVSGPVEQMARYYDAFEFSNSLKPFLHEYIFERTDAEAWLYLDSDILVCNDLQVIWDNLRDASILLSPHLTHAPSTPNAMELQLLTRGIYNGGIVGLRRSQSAAAFVQWHKTRTTQFGFDSPATGLYVDQAWLSFVPSYFRDVKVIDHPGVNVAYWNLHERQIERQSDGRITANGEPLTLLHFSGWDIANPGVISKYARGIETPQPLAELGHVFRDLLLANGYAELSKAPYAFDIPGAQPAIAEAQRQEYYRSVADNPGLVRFIAPESRSRKRTLIRRITRRIKRSLPGGHAS